MNKNTDNRERTIVVNGTARFCLQFTVAALLSSWMGFASSADLPDFTALVKSNEAAVVNISTIGEGARNNRRGSPRNEQLEEFFREDIFYLFSHACFHVLAHASPFVFPPCPGVFN